MVIVIIDGDAAMIDDVCDSVAAAVVVNLVPLCPTRPSSTRGGVVTNTAVDGFTENREAPM